MAPLNQEHWKRLYKRTIYNGVRRHRGTTVDGTGSKGSLTSPRPEGARRGNNYWNCQRKSHEERASLIGIVTFGWGTQLVPTLLFIRCPHLSNPTRIRIAEPVDAVRAHEAISQGLRWRRMKSGSGGAQRSNVTCSHTLCEWRANGVMFHA